MTEIPFSLPKSLQAYAEHFVAEPTKTIDKLSRHLERRGMDAVGYFLLAWLLLQQGEKAKAIEAALKAKSYAPGSPFLTYLHYFLHHPGQFEAWVPTGVHRDAQTRKRLFTDRHFLLDLETLISRLNAVETQKITFDPNEPILEDLSAKSEQVEDIASLTLAGIYEQQGKIEQAIHAYERLIQLRPERKEEFMARITQLQQAR